MENEIMKCVEHPIEEVDVASEELKAIFNDSGIDSVEQAVAFLCAAGIEEEGKDEFLASAKDVLGEEAFLKYSTPVEQPPLGCKMPTPAMEVVAVDPLPATIDEATQLNQPELNQTENQNKPSEECKDETVDK